MSSEESEQVSKKNFEFVYTAPDEQSSSEEPRSAWSSLELEVVIEEENKKKVLYDEGLYSPGSGEVCVKAITMSNSSMFRHKYYKYRSVSDPGIEDALFLPECPPVNLPNDGQALYLQVCEEMNICPVRMFHKNLLNTEINLKYYGVKQGGVRAMAEALKYNTKVSRFDLTSNYLNDDACYHLGQVLRVNNTLRELILDGCRIGASGMLRLGNELRFNRVLEYLSIGDNNLRDAGGLHFVKQISDGANVKRVNLGKNQLSKETALGFTDLWEWKNSFTQLDLSWNNFFHVPTTCKMLNQLASSSCLRELNLSFNSLQGDRVANAIKNVLLIPTLDALDLSNNKLQQEAIKIITSELFSAHNLKVFDLSYNPLTPQDAYNVLKKMLCREIEIKILLMKSICVRKPFIELLSKVKEMPIRQDFVCEFDTVLHNWTIVGPDARETLLRRAQYLGSTAHPKVDMAKYFIALTKQYEKPIPIKDFIQRLDDDHVPLDEDFIDELPWAFEGPTIGNSRTVQFSLITDFIFRLWPDKKLPPSPAPDTDTDVLIEPEPEPGSLLPPPQPKVKVKGKGQK